eukprot:ANDGO_06638.mRNA.1 hypothetical protein
MNRSRRPKKRGRFHRGYGQTPDDSSVNQSSACGSDSAGVSQSASSQQESSIPGYIGELPGFVFDKSKGKYFRITKNTPREVASALLESEKIHSSHATRLDHIAPIRPPPTMFQNIRNTLLSSNTARQRYLLDTSTISSIKDRSRILYGFPLRVSGWHRVAYHQQRDCIFAADGPCICLGSQECTFSLPGVDYFTKLKSCPLPFTFAAISQRDDKLPSLALVSVVESEDMGWGASGSVHRFSPRSAFDEIRDFDENPADVFRFLTCSSLTLREVDVRTFSVVTDYPFSNGQSCSYISSSPTSPNQDCCSVLVGGRNGVMAMFDSRDARNVERLGMCRMPFAPLSIHRVPYHSECVVSNVDGSLALIDFRMRRIRLWFRQGIPPSAVNPRDFCFATDVSQDGEFVYSTARSTDINVFRTGSGSCINTLSIEECQDLVSVNNSKLIYTTSAGVHAMELPPVD